MADWTQPAKVMMNKALRRMGYQITRLPAPGGTGRFSTLSRGTSTQTTGRSGIAWPSIR